MHLGLGYIHHPQPVTVAQMKKINTAYRNVAFVNIYLATVHGQNGASLYGSIFSYQSSDDLFVSGSLSTSNAWEADMVQTLCDKFEDIKGRADFVDVGANIGYFSLLAASVVGEQGAIFAFEPDPDNYRLLLANAELNGMEHRIAAVEAALSDVTGEGQLYLSADNLGDHQVYADDEQRSSVCSQMYTYDLGIRGFCIDEQRSSVCSQMYTHDLGISGLCIDD